MQYPRLKDLREDLDLRQTDVAKFLGMNQQQYSRYETGKQTITTELLVKLASYYHSSTDYILGLTDVRKPYPKISNMKKEKISSR